MNITTLGERADTQQKSLAPHCPAFTARSSDNHYATIASMYLFYLSISALKNKFEHIEETGEEAVCLLAENGARFRVDKVQAER